MRDAILALCGAGGVGAIVLLVLMLGHDRHEQRKRAAFDRLRALAEDEFHD